MMTINKTIKDQTMSFDIEGRLDTMTAPELEKELKSIDSSITELIINFEKLEYISSVGLRLLLSAQKIMNKQGSMVVKNVNEAIMEIFEVTGFVDILNIQ